MLMALPVVLCAQSAPLRAHFSVEEYLVDGHYPHGHATRDRYFRPYALLESGDWSLTATYWSYPACHFYEVDDTHLDYDDGSLHVKVGRFLVPVGQDDWDDEWYSGTVFMPMIQLIRYGSFGALWHTSTGAEASVPVGPGTFTAALVSSSQQKNQLLPDDFDRAVFRYQGYVQGLTYGVSALTDSKGLGKDERLLDLDLRYTTPHFIARGEMLGYSTTGSTNEGFYVDLYHRPAGWQDVLFVGRFEAYHFSKGTRLGRKERTTLGAKVRAPFDSTLMVNYIFGPSINGFFLGGAWAIGLTKTLRF